MPDPNTKAAPPSELPEYLASALIPAEEMQQTFENDFRRRIEEMTAAGPKTAAEVRDMQDAARVKRRVQELVATNNE